MAVKLTTSPDAALRARALLGRVRILRKLNQLDEALRAYGLLSRIPDIANDGVPVDLVAWNAGGDRHSEHRHPSVSLLARLDARGARHVSAAGDCPGYGDGAYLKMPCARPAAAFVR